MWFLYRLRSLSCHPSLKMWTVMVNSSTHPSMIVWSASAFLWASPMQQPLADSQPSLAPPPTSSSWNILTSKWYNVTQLMQRHDLVIIWLQEADHCSSSSLTSCLPVRLEHVYCVFRSTNFLSQLYIQLCAQFCPFFKIIRWNPAFLLLIFPQCSHCLKGV